MLVIQKIPLTHLLAADLTLYKRLTLTSGQFLFQKLTTSEDSIIAIEARLDECLVGLALAEYYPHYNQTAQLFSFVIQEDYRNQKIGKSLFFFLQNHLVQEYKIRALGFEYAFPTPYTEAWEKILKEAQWHSPDLYRVLFYFDPFLFNPPWLHFSIPLPPDITLFAWNQLSEADRARIAYLKDQGRFLPYLSPLLNESQINLASSLGMRKGPLIIGWCVTQHCDAESLSFKSLFIDKDYIALGYGIRLLSESIRLYQHHIKKLRANNQPFPPWVLFEINLEQIDPTWKKFVKKRLAPYSTKLVKLKWAFKAFNY